MPIPDHDLNSDLGYIVESGSFYPCEHHEHTELAAALIEQRYGIEPDDPDKMAEHYGWIKVGRISIYSGLGVSYTQEPNSAQLETLQDWCDKRELNMRDLLTI